MQLSILQQVTLYDRIFKKTIVIIMRVFKIMPGLMDKIYKDRVKPLKRGNMCLTNGCVDGTIVED